MILDEIVAASQKRACLIDASVKKEAEHLDYSPKSLLRAVLNSKKNKNAVIAEIKYKTPSDSTINSSRTPGELSGIYERAGACAVSVLTEPYYFAGSLENIKEAKKAGSLPVLRKDFIVSEMQIYETYAAGADSALLISGVLDKKLFGFISLCRSFQIEPLVEVRTKEDAENAIKSGARLAGINNRNLSDMSVDISKTKEISKMLLDCGITVISESGIKTPSDIRSLKNYCDGFLIGTSLMKAQNPKEMLEGFVFA